MKTPHISQKKGKNSNKCRFFDTRQLKGCLRAQFNKKFGRYRNSPYLCTVKTKQMVATKDNNTLIK
jgi:hypothetical protein